MLDHRTSLDRAFFALSDPSRRLMLERLSRGPASVSDLAVPLSMTLAAVVQHVQVLQNSGLVDSEKRGRVRTCRMDSAALGTAERWIAAQRTEWELRLDRLGELLGEGDQPI